MKARQSVLYAATLVALFTAGCVPAAIAGGAVVVGVGAIVLASGCDEPVNVDVWDGQSSHPICDANVVAQRLVTLDDLAGKDLADPRIRREGGVVTFSPCYGAHLGSGSWIVTATRPGAPPATGLVTISDDRKCSVPTYHSLELTLGSSGAIPERFAPPPSAPPAPPPPYSTVPGPATAPPTGTSPAPVPAPAPAAPAPAAPPSGPPPPAPAPASSNIPTAGFPSNAPAPPASAVPAPPAR